MTFVTKISLQSGNRRALERVVSEIRSTAEQKGAELKGPHSDPPDKHRVPQYKSLTGDESRQFRGWDYTVYAREMEIVGHNDVVRQVANTAFPDGVHVEVAVEQVQSLGTS